MRNGIVFIIFLFMTVSVQAADSLSKRKVNELPVSLLEDSMKKNPKPVVIYYMASWCKWCKVLEANVFKDSTIIDSLNAHYYFVKFDGEYKEDFKFLGRTYSYIKTGDNQGYHEFCMVFDRVVSYPSLVFLSPHFERKETIVGYLKPEKFLGKLLNNLK